MMTPDQATAETVAALGELAPRFRVTSTPNPHACAPLRAAEVRTVVVVAAPLTTTADVLSALRSLPGIVQVSADSRDVIIFRSDEP
jgi:hypothetical protein